MGTAYTFLLIAISPLIIVRSGQASTNAACGGQLTAQAGNIMSPNFPNSYPDRVTCVWTITVADNQVITLKFHDFRVDSYDKVIFYDGDNPTKPVLNNGNENQTGFWGDLKLSNFRVRSTSHSLHIIFTASYPQSGPGFSASYWAHECLPFTYGIDYCVKNCSCQEENTLYCNTTSGQCVCKSGWKSTRCDVDVNECDDPNMCPDLYAHCNNKPGHFSCDCEAGMKINSTGHCVSNCTTQPNKCSHACGVISSNIEQCYCPKGMQLNSTNNQLCVPCRDWLYGQNCKYQSTCEKANTKVLNRVNGLCTCYSNWTSTDCSQDFNECTVNACNTTTSTCSNRYGSYECQCYVGYENIDGQTCEACGKILTNTTGTITSGYYYHYSSTTEGDEVCSWTVSVHPSQVVDLMFDSISLYKGYQGMHGFVRIYDGSDISSPLLTQIDGLTYHNNRLPDVYTRSSGNQMHIVRSIRSYDSGFVARYRSHECKDFFYSTNCSTPCNCKKSNTDYCNSTTGQCICKPHWTSPDCTVDKNECLVDPLACPNYSDCKNLQPGYQCDCKMGLEKDDHGQCIYSKTDSVACNLKNCSHYCVHLNQNPEEHCYCPIGMSLHEDTCFNCSNGTFGPDCSLKCSCVENNTASCDPVSGRCVCLPGWTSDNCSEDIDECYWDLHTCTGFSNCRNTPGDYDCVCDRSNGLDNDDHRTCKRLECNQTLTNSSGIISSPDYPRTYYNDANCTWMISVEEGNVISLRFDEFKIGLHDSDYVMFYNGRNTLAKTIGRYAGTLDAVPHIIRSDGNTMFINFISDSWTYWDNLGFNATYFSHPCRDFKFGETCSEYCHCNSENTQYCDNIKGECVCKPGWKGNTCFDDVNECLGTNNALCPINSECHNTDGSYECRCHRGFMKNINNNICEAYDGCYEKQCSHACYRDNKADKETCSCPDGLELDVSGLICVVPYYPYGTEAKDHKLSPETHSQSLNQETILMSTSIYFSSGAPFGLSEQMIKVAYVMSNGVVAFGEESVYLPGSPNLEHAFLQDLNILAPYWADIDPKTGHVNYHLYEKCGQAAFDGTKDDETSPLKVKIMSRAKSDLMKYYNMAGFEVDSVLVVTWVGVEHLSSSNDQQEKNTFQAVFVSGWEKKYQEGQEILLEEETSYVIFLYQQGQMNWTYVAGRLINIGFTGNIMPDTDTAFISTLDKVKGNTGYNGVYSYQTGRSNSPIQKCHRYTCNNVALISDPVYENEKRTLYKCPCTMERLGRQWQLFDKRGEHKDIHCYAISQVAKSRLLASNKRNKLCCYQIGKPKNPEDWRDVEQTMRDASYVPASPVSGHVLIYEPWPWYYYHNDAALENIKAHTTCCMNSPKELCERFYKIFPDMGCTDFVEFVPASALGEPHITTLDGVTYTMNGWGEYILMDVKSENFTLQARTSRVETSNGTLANATVFTAFAAREGDYAKLQVELSTNNKSLVIFVNGMDITNDFYNDQEFHTELDMISVLREDSANRTLVITTFQCGVTIKVSVAVKSLDIELEVDVNLKNKTLGLLGNFNENKSDEFTLPDGVVLPSNMSEREIFTLFAKNWEVTESNTVFVYGRREKPSNYQHHEFVPFYTDQASPQHVKEAEEFCGKNNSACIFDYIVTGTVELALNTKESFLKMESKAIQLENNPPELTLKNDSLNSFGHWVVTEGVQATLEVSTYDEDSDEVQIEILANSGDANAKNKSILYTPNIKTPLKLGVRSKDSKGAYSSIVYVTIAVCTNCSGHGQCTNSTRDTEYSDGHFLIFKCSCNSAYTGADCESELDACASKPCSVGQECADLTAAQQGNNLTGYVCGPCPDGYTNYNGKCVDIDECRTNNSICQHNCTNTEGSYLCTCRNGFRIDPNHKKACIDINECEEQTYRCQHRCMNTEGGYNCSCREDYDIKPDGYSCELKSSGIQKCSHCQHICVFNNLDNIATCICKKGYFQDPKNDAECLDIDECKLENMPCSQGCNNTDGNFNCYCYPGFKMESDGVSCKACEVPYYGDNCNKTCDCNGRGSCNTVKGCVCNDNWTGVNCDIDVDECATSGACPEGEICENTNGSFTCFCPIGYIMEGAVCKDVNECLSPQTNGTCNPHNEACINTVGSYRCECKRGYSRDSNKLCQDIDECKLGSDRCQQLCHNVDGRYNCECEAGYILAEDRHNCVKVQDLCESVKLNCTHGCSILDEAHLYCICPRGYILLEQHTCVDINECASAENNSCSYKPGCNNTDGGYTCSCPAGFKLDNNGRNCLACTGDTWGVECSEECACGIGAEKCDPETGCICQTGYTGEHCQNDINECSTVNFTCSEKEICINLPGTAMCICQDGYHFDVSGSCVDINECSGNNNCTQICTNSEGSYSCSCYAGYTYNITSKICLDIDECKLGKHQCDKLCTNTEGSYRCSCSIGLFLQTDGVSCGADKPCTTSFCSDNCANIDGTDTCLCGKGKILGSNNMTCEDLDLCESSSCTEGCFETKGNTSFECLCDIGKKLAADGITCTECINGKYGVNCSRKCSCDMSQTDSCNNINGTCECTAGWQGENCTVDIDECADNSRLCQDHSHCVNTNGSSFCACDDGFIERENICTECDDNSYGPTCKFRCTCGKNFKCNKTTGSCYCEPGWEGANCDTDIDECKETIHNCSSTQHEACDNINGGYQCICDIGYSKSCKLCECEECVNGRYGINCIEDCRCEMANSKFCDKFNGTCECKNGWKGDSCATDVDECAEKTVSCRTNSHCVNTNGSHLCECDVGYFEESHVPGDCKECNHWAYGDNCTKNCSCVIANSQSCDKINGTCECKTGWKGVNCESDQDECNEKAVSCKIHSHCVNTNGSYMCQCNVGYFDGNDTNGECKDRDECTENSVSCKSNAHCVNTNGSYMCQCNVGYYDGNDTNGECKECNHWAYGDNCTKNCTCVIANSQSCDKINGTCECKTGWKGENCEIDVNECAEKTLSCRTNSHCVNNLGSFECECNDGFFDLKNECTKSVLIISVPATIRLDYNASGKNLTDNTFKESVGKGLFESLRKFNQSIKLVTVINLSLGSLIVDSNITMEANNINDKSNEMSLAKAFLDMTQNKINITIEGISSAPEMLKLNSYEILKTDKFCDARKKIQPCSSSEWCSDDEKACIVRVARDSLNLILGMSIGLSLFVLLFTSVGIIVCCWKKKHSVKKLEWSEPQHLSDHQHQIRGPILDDSYLHQSRTRNEDYHGQTPNEYLEISTGSWHGSALSYQHPKTRIASPSSMFPSEAPHDGHQRDTKYRGHPRN